MRPSLLLVGLLAAAALPVAIAQDSGGMAGAEAGLVGKDAPPLSTSDWLNSQGRTQVSDFKGEVLLVECFATWCGPCRGQMPHLSKLTEEYGPRGFTVLSITNEPREVVLKYLAQLNNVEIKYTMGCGGGTGNYPATGIPKGFLVGVDGKVIWEGHPAGLPIKLLEDELKKVKITDEQKEARAARAIEYAESLISSKQVLRGVAMLDKVARESKGTAAGKKAEERKAAVEKDEATRRELAAQRALDKLVGGLDLPSKLKGKERDARAVQLEGFIKKNEADAPAAAETARMWVKVMKEDWKAER